MPYTPRPVPQTSLSPDSDVGKLSQYIDEEQRSIARAMQEVEQMQYTVLGSAPERPREGMIAYANGTTWNPSGVGPGLVQYRGFGWRRLLDTVEASIWYVSATASKFTAYVSGVQGGFPHGNWGIVVFSSVAYNTGGGYQGNSYWVPPAGRIHINAHFYAYPGSGVAAEGAIAIYINGAHSGVQSLHAPSFNRSVGVIAADFVANGSQYFQIGAYTSNSASDYSNVDAGHFSGHWLGSS